MTGWQKTIKYIATAFAVLLAVSIFGGIFSLLGLLTGITALPQLFDNDAVSDKMQTYTVSQTVTDLRMDIGAAALTVKTGEAFCVESNVERLKVEEKNGCLVIEQSQWFSVGITDDTAKLVLTVPADFVFDDADITTGAGFVNVDTLSAKTLQMELGAGAVTIKRLEVLRDADIDSGAGKVTVESGEVCNLDFDMGVGDLEMTAVLLGDNEISCGVGKAHLVLNGAAEEYTVDAEKGIGSVTINGRKVSRYGNGATRVNIEGGVGDIEVDFRPAA